MLVLLWLKHDHGFGAVRTYNFDMPLDEIVRKIQTMPEEEQALVSDFVDMLAARRNEAPFGTPRYQLRPYQRDEVLHQSLGTITDGGSIDNDAIDADLARAYSGQ